MRQHLTGQQFRIGFQHFFTGSASGFCARCQRSYRDPSHNMEQALRMTCVEANCANERNGWVTVLDPSDPKHAKGANWIREDQGRHYIDLRSEDALEYLDAYGAGIGVVGGNLRGIVERTPPGMLIFIFPPGQQCFRPHLDREVAFVHRDSRGGERVHTRPVDWNEHMNIEGDRVNQMRQRG